MIDRSPDVASIRLMWVLLVILVACQVQTAGPGSTPRAPSSATPDTPVVRSTPSSAPLTPTRASNVTPKPIVVTVAPSPDPAQEQALVLALLKTNAGCRLPCWWGIAPGQTLWETAATYFASLGKQATEYRRNALVDYTVRFTAEQHNLKLGQVFRVRDGVIDMITVGSTITRDDRVVYDDAQYTQDWQRYVLPNLLKEYGRPTEIWLSTVNAPLATGLIPYDLLLLYSNGGFLVRYRGAAQPVQDLLQICPRESVITLWLWATSRSMTLEKIARTGQDLDTDLGGLRSLEDATGIGVEDFVERFAESRMCLETPAVLWP